MAESPELLLLDTHVWIWLALGSDELRAPMREQIAGAAAAGRLLLSSMSVLESARLIALGRLAVDRPAGEWLRAALRATGVRLLPVDADVAIESYALPEAFHRDPADRAIVATARLQNATLITRDELIHQYSVHGSVKVLPA